MKKFRVESGEYVGYFNTDDPHDATAKFMLACRALEAIPDLGAIIHTEEVTDGDGLIDQGETFWTSVDEILKRL